MLLLICGPSGSGKSTLAGAITKYNVAADDFMKDSEGNYVFNPSKLGECHKSCQDAAEKWLSEFTDETIVAVHNTFTKRWERKPYMDLAKKHGHTVTVIVMDQQHQNQHGVPKSKVDSYWSNWEPNRNGC